MHCENPICKYLKHAKARQLVDYVHTFGSQCGQQTTAAILIMLQLVLEKLKGLH